ncbi:MAG: hypothetical protein ACK5M3_13060 [Dysgonomonas sp.]
MNTFKWIVAVFFLTVFADNKSVQASVIASFDVAKSEIIIQNNRSEAIYIFRKDISSTSDDIKIFDRNIILISEKLFTLDCLDIKESYVKVLSGQKRILKVKHTKTRQLYYYIFTKSNVNTYFSIPINNFSQEKPIRQFSWRKNPRQQRTPTKIDTSPRIKSKQITLDSVHTKQDFTIDKSIINKFLEKEIIDEKEEVNTPPAKVNPKNPVKKQPKVSQEEVFNTFKDEYQHINSECQSLLRKGAKLQTSEKQYLKRQQQYLNKLRLDIKNVEPNASRYKQLKKRLLSQVTSLIERISEVTITKSKTIKEDYQEIYSKYKAHITELNEQDLKIEALVEHKLREFSLIRWRNKDVVYSNISAFNDAVDSSEKSFEIDKIQFINKWGQEDKEILENLLIRKNDELKDSYNNLRYNASLYQKRIDELTPPYAILIALAFVCLVILIALIFYIRAFIRHRAIESQKSVMMESAIRSIDEEKEEIVLYQHGLEQVRSEVKNNEYYVVDMNTVFDDTAIEKVYISKSCVLSIYRFFLEFLKLNGKTNETGCFVIGRWEPLDSGSYNISLEEIIEPGNDAIYGEYELDFGTQIGIGLESAIISARQVSQQDYVQTCWIHSHPSIGLFLSNHDLIVQSQLVYSEHPMRMLAIVIDSNTEDLDTAFFTSKKSGEMNNKEDLKTILSFEQIAQWARGIIVEQPEKIVFDSSHYYECISNCPDALIDTFLFSGASIIDIDYTINPNAEGLKGYFYGKLLYKSSDKSLQKKVLIENFDTSSTKDGGEPIGCLLVLPQFSYQTVLVKYEPIVDRYDFFVVYSTQQDDLRIISRSENGKYLVRSERDLHSVQMTELRKWTRRRRY